MSKSKFGTSRDIPPETKSIFYEGQEIKFTISPNPDCRCTPMQAMFCPYGHMLECHRPLTCEEAECSHLARYKEW